MVFVIRVSYWFRFKVWFAVKLMQLATWLISMRPKAAEKAGIVPLTPEQIRSLQDEMGGRPLH